MWVCALRRLCLHIFGKVGFPMCIDVALYFMLLLPSFRMVCLKMKNLRNLFTPSNPCSISTRQQVPHDWFPRIPCAIIQKNQRRIILDPHTPLSFGSIFQPQQGKRGMHSKQEDFCHMLIWKKSGKVPSLIFCLACLLFIAQQKPEASPKFQDLGAAYYFSHLGNS